MALMVYAEVSIVDSSSGATIVNVFNRETVQLPGVPGPLQPGHGELLAGVLDRLAEDVKDRGVEQAKEFTRTP